MKDIAVIIPIHKSLGESEVTLLEAAVESYNAAKETYTDGSLNLYVVGPNEVKDIVKAEHTFIPNNGETDFCSQVNLAVMNVKEEYFSILEFDDRYNKRWFNMVHDYFETREDVTVFLPIVVQRSLKENYSLFNNEFAWRGDDSSEIGYINIQRATMFNMVNVTGAVINTDDFKKLGGFKKDMSIAFAYEFIMRAANKDLRIFVVPKEGYYHTFDRDDAWFTSMTKTLNETEGEKIFEKATKEYSHIEELQ